MTRQLNASQIAGQAMVPPALEQPPRLETGFQTRQESIIRHLEKQVESQPTQEALLFEGQSTTYAELWSRAQAIAVQLAGLGLGKQDKVGVLFPNHPDFIATFFAVIGLGGVVVPINPLLRSEEISHILADSGAKMLVVHNKSLPEVKKAASSLKGLESVVISGARTDSTLVKSGLSVTQLTTRRSVKQDLLGKVSIDPASDLALIVYTSGTTGKPKGARLTHNNVQSVLPDPLLAMFDIDHRDRCLGVLPLCHIYGIGVVMFSMLAKGGSVVIMSKFDAKAVLSTIEHARVTLIPAVPSMYQFMLMELEGEDFNLCDLSSVRLCFSGAAALSRELLKKVEDRFGAPVIEGYALSETVCGATINPLHAPKAGSIGKALPALQVGIRAEDGKFLPSGKEHVGEIAIKGPNVMDGYHNQPEATAEVMSDGWFLTGDLGYSDEDGYLYIVGRKKEMIIRGGQNIYPREVEDVIARLPGVREAAVIGIADELMGERVKAIVVVDEGVVLTEEEVKAHCEAHLAPYKTPRLVTIRTEFLPRNSTGKVLKRLLS